MSGVSNGILFRRDPSKTGKGVDKRKDRRTNPNYSMINIRCQQEMCYPENTCALSYVKSGHLTCLLLVNKTSTEQSKKVSSS